MGTIGSFASINSLLVKEMAAYIAEYFLGKKFLPSLVRYRIYGGKVFLTIGDKDFIHTARINKDELSDAIIMACEIVIKEYNIGQVLADVYDLCNCFSMIYHKEAAREFKTSMHVM